LPARIAANQRERLAKASASGWQSGTPQNGCHCGVENIALSANIDIANDINPTTLTRTIHESDCVYAIRDGKTLARPASDCIYGNLLYDLRKYKKHNPNRERYTYEQCFPEKVRHIYPLLQYVSSAADRTGAQARQHHRRAPPGNLSACSTQLGTAVAPSLPERLQRMRGPKDGTVASSGHSSILTARWWPQRWQVTNKPRTPCRRVLPSVMGRTGASSLVIQPGKNVWRTKSSDRDGFQKRNQCTSAGLTRQGSGNGPYVTHGAQT
jgi:hypothetical protein